MLMYIENVLELNICHNDVDPKSQNSLTSFLELDLTQGRCLIKHLIKY